MGVNLSRFVEGQIRRGNATISRRGFGIFGMVCVTPWAQRSRTFADDSEVLAALKAGFIAAGNSTAVALAKALEHPAYLGAVAFCTPENRAPSFKVLKRAGTPIQKMRFTPSTPAAGEVFSITIRGVTFSVTADATPLQTEIVDLFVALMTVDVDAIIATGGVTAATAQALVAAAFNGVVGAGVFATPRNVTFALSSHADWDVGAITVTGLDQVGRVQQEILATPNGGNVTLTGTKLWSKITNVAISAMSGAGGTYTMGVGVKFDVNGLLVFTPTDGNTYLDIVNTNAGDWYGYQDVTANLAIEDRSTDDVTTTLTADLVAIATDDPNFYAFSVLDGESKAMILLAAAWAETHVVSHFPQNIDTEVETNDLTGIHAELRDLEYVRTLPVHTRINHRSRFVCGLMGLMMGKTVGSAPHIYKTISGQRADSFGLEVLNRVCGSKEDPLSGTRGLIYIDAMPDGSLVGQPITYGGFTSGGVWAHQVAGVDAARADMQAAFIQRRINTDNVPFTEQGAAADEGDVHAVLLKFAKGPFNLFDEGSIRTTHTPVADIDAATRKLGNYDGVSFVVNTQGTIATLVIRGVVN